ncbi:MAG: DNA mismatch repair protein MutL, partial [Bacteroidetes bacterium]|nr:DNA mismatch repair protein MutL [Bacteroidota bacterium]
QEPVAMPVGTSIAMKNVFFNVPARRNFLKSNAAEMRHIVDEFIRVALAFPDIFFSLTGNNGQQVFHLERGTLKQRIVQILGAQYNARLVTVQEKTDYLNIYGFVGKPETAKKTRGDQYFFVNNRFIRSPYLNHAMMNAYQDIIPADSFPAYVLFIDLDPAQIDINVHPTKQEIKFEDEKIVYAFIQAAVKHALAQFSVTPTLEFDLDPNIQQLDAITKPFTEDKQEAASSTDLFKNFTQKNQAHFIQPAGKSELRHWKDFYEPAKEQGGQSAPRFESLLDKIKSPDAYDSDLPAATGQQPAYTGALQWIPETPLIQLHHTYIIASTNRGFILVHQQLAHERVLYNRFSEAMRGKAMATQRSLFPVTLELATQDAVLLTDLLADLQQLGYEVESFGKDSFVIQGTPADLPSGNEKQAIESLLEQFKHFSSDMKFSKREKVLRAMAWQRSVKPGRSLSKEEMHDLISEMFGGPQPNVTAGGNPTYIEFKWEYLNGLFNRP